VLVMTNEEFGITSTLKKYADGVIYSHTISAAIGELRIEVDITDPRTRDAQIAAFLRGAAPMIFDERQYQTDAIATTNQRVAEGHRPIVCAATGSGKTVIAARMAKQAFDENRRVLWMTGREEILRQTFKTFNEFLGVGKVGILMRDEGPWWMYPPVTVASWDTLKARWHKSDLWKIPADVVLVDEAHLSLSEIMSQTIMPHYRDKGAKVIGFTATPARRSGRGLGSYFTRIIQVRSVQQLIDDGFLAPCEYWAGAHVDLEKVKVDSSDERLQGSRARARVDGRRS
jgi:superfamily II DNA or RNA helicase